MGLEVTSVVCWTGTEVDWDELDAGRETTDGDGCGGSVVTDSSSAFARGGKLMLGRVF